MQKTHFSLECFGIIIMNAAVQAESESGVKLCLDSKKVVVNADFERPSALISRSNSPFSFLSRYGMVIYRCNLFLCYARYKRKSETVETESRFCF